MWYMTTTNYWIRCAILPAFSDCIPYYTFCVKLIVLRKELTTGENNFMSLEIFGPRGWLPLAVTFALVIRAFLRSVLSWERRALKIDNYGFIVESKWFCDFDHVSEHISLNILAELFVNRYLLYIFVQINRIYTSMEISRRDMNKNIKWQSTLVIMCTLFQSRSKVDKVVFTHNCRVKN